MKSVVLSILCMLPCNAMQMLSRLECLPTDLKLEIMKHAISSAASKKQAIETIRKWLAYDKALQKNNFHRTRQTWLEDQLGWYWHNSAIPIALAPTEATSKFFTTLREPERIFMLDPQLRALKSNFDRFFHMAKANVPIPPDLLAQIDLHHCYAFAYLATIMPDSTLANGKWTPLYTAVKFNRPDAVAQLLQLGCDTEKLSNEDLTPLQYASKTANNDMVQIFINHQIPLNTQNKNGDTALHLAFSSSHLVFLQLIAAGANPNIPNKAGWKFEAAFAELSWYRRPPYVRVNMANQ